MKLKILIHQPRFSYYVGGGEVIPLFQASSLSKLGNDVEILTSEPPVYSQIFNDFKKENSKIKINTMRLPERYQNIYTITPGKDWSRWDEEALLFGQSSEKFYIENIGKWDLVVTHLLSDSFFIPNEFVNILRLHGVPSERRDIDRIFLKRPNAFVPDCKSVRDGWRKLYPNLKDVEMPISYNGVDSKLFKPLNMERVIDFLYVGRFIKIKGIYDILKAIRILKTKGVKFNKLVMVGHGPEETNIRSFLKKEKIFDKVEIRKPQSQHELVELYNKAKIFLGPSYSKEGVISTMLEAASCGTAIITANACGMPEFAKHKKNSLVINPQNHKQLAEYMEQLLADDKLRLRLSSKAREDIEKKWDIMITVKHLNEIYSKYVKK